MCGQWHHSLAEEWQKILQLFKWRKHLQHLVLRWQKSPVLEISGSWYLVSISLSFNLFFLCNMFFLQENIIYCIAYLYISCSKNGVHFIHNLWAFVFTNVCPWWFGLTCCFPPSKQWMDKYSSFWSTVSLAGELGQSSCNSTFGLFCNYKAKCKSEKNSL